MSTSSHSSLTEAIAAARAGDRSRARDLLSRLIRSDSANAEAWLWMSAVVDTEKERIYCLESALNLDPTNRAVRRGLVILGARKPEDEPRKKTSVPRRKVVASTSASPTRTRLTWGMVGAIFLGLVFFAMVGGVVLAFRGMGSGAVVAPTLPPATDTPTPTPVIPTATPTPIPVETLSFRTPIPTELAQTPIVFFVPATPTPTPLIGVTPHPSYEAYRAGITAFNRGDYEAVQNFMGQVIGLDPTLADPHYFLGEALRLSGNPVPAIQAYDRAVVMDSEFAPGYLGRALAQLELTRRQENELSGADIPEDFDRALERDPRYLQAYLAKAEILAELRLWRTMEETLQAALDQGLRDPAVYIGLSVAQYNRGNYEAALENATRGSAADPTNLDGYLALGRAHTALDEFERALWPLQTYVAYRFEDPLGWGHLARTYYEQGDIGAALDAANQALELNDRYAPAYATRALVNLQLDNLDEALNDVQRARQYGAESYQLFFAFANVHYARAEYVEAVQMVNEAIAAAETPARKADSYALRALIYEATNPPLLDEARLNWQWVLDTEGARETTILMAQTHLAALTGEGPTLTPAVTPTETPTPEPTGDETDTGEPTPTPTATTPVP